MTTHSPASGRGEPNAIPVWARVSIQAPLWGFVAFEREVRGLAGVFDHHAFGIPLDLSFGRFIESILYYFSTSFSNGTLLWSTVSRRPLSTFNLAGFRHLVLAIGDRVLKSIFCRTLFVYFSTYYAQTLVGWRSPFHHLCKEEWVIYPVTLGALSLYNVSSKG